MGFEWHKIKLSVTFFLGFIIFSSAWGQRKKDVPYFPEPGNWEKREPAHLGLNPQKLAEAIQFAQAHGAKANPNLEIAHYESFGKEPFGDAIGPFKKRGVPSGVIVHKGYVVGEWGDPWRVDMTFSVTKSFLSSLVGVAFDRKMISNLHEPVYKEMAPLYVLPGNRQDRANHLGDPMLVELFNTEHNRTISWDHLLRQTSDWEGELWGKPDWADRPVGDLSIWRTRERNKPGSSYKYNDVRVNVLALAIMNRWRKPLPQVLKENIMDPIGASATWRWMGYDHSFVVMDGVVMQAVGGGGHWGGGMFIHAYDMARFGYLTLWRGKWKEKQLLSEEWVKMALTPTEVQPTYGFMNWFLNTDKKLYSHAPSSSFAHLGNGTNMIYVDPEHDLVVVCRWIERGSENEFIGKVLEAIKEK